MRVALNFARSQLDYNYVVHELVCDIHPGDYDGKVGIVEQSLTVAVARSRPNKN